MPAEVVDIRIRGLIVQLEGLVAKRDQDIVALSSAVRTARSAGQTVKSPLVQRNLKRILALKKSRASVVSHMHTLETQLDCIESQSYNTQLVATMKASATTMREMGISQNLKDADQTLASLQENMDTAGEVTNALAVPLTDVIDDDELDAEFDAIINEGAIDAVAQLGTGVAQAPTSSNSMIVTHLPTAAGADDSANSRGTSLYTLVEEQPQPADDSQKHDTSPLVEIPM